jgi:hypothetical protein
VNRQLRDTVLFATGILGYMAMLYSWTVNGVPPNPYLVVLCGGMLGLPAFLRADELLRPGRKDNDET